MARCSRKTRAGAISGCRLSNGAGAGLFFGLGASKPSMIEFDACDRGRVDHEVEREAEGLVEMEGFVAEV